MKNLVLMGMTLWGAAAFGRTTECLNDGWSGTVTPEKGESRTVENILIPHNWDDYYGHRNLFHGELHGSCVYRKTLSVSKRPGERQFLVFDGAGTFLTVQLNGRELCQGTIRLLMNLVCLHVTPNRPVLV